jgi:hypothetical protein
MLRKTTVIASSLTLLMLAACTTIPDGPSVMVLPGTGKSFDQFRTDDYSCRQFASTQVNGNTATTAQQDSGVRSAALGTLIGAAAGAAINGGHGAGVGAGAGLALGALTGTEAGNTSGYNLQRRYDHSYVQCMYAYGHRVPTSGRFEGAYRTQQPSYQQPSYQQPSTQPSYPPPPPGSPPPAPPGYR